MNPRQQKQYDKINLFLSQFEAKIKDGEEYVNALDRLTILNKYGIEKIIEPFAIKRLKSNNNFWTFDGSMNDKQRREYDRLKTLVESKGGKIKEGEIYIDNNTKIIFMDQNGLLFKTIPKIIKNGSWGRSADSDYQMEQIKKIVELNNWKIKDGQSYISANTNMILIDQDGFEFKMTPSRIKQGIVNNKDPSFHMKKIQQIVESKGGKIKTGEIYVNSRTKMTFIDENEFEFTTTPSKIKQGFWNNGKGISEEICRQCIEFIFKNSFPSNWSIVIRKDQKNLQLDGYNSQLKIAFEYQGEQHYYFKYQSGKNNVEKYKNFKNQTQRDLFKEHFCKDKGIKLIKVKYFDNINMKKDIDYLNHVILEILKSHKILNKYIVNLDKKKFKIKPISQKKEKLNYLKKLVESKGGKIKQGEVYKGTHEKMTFIDENGFEFITTPSIILRGCWSPYSVNKIIDSDYQLQQIKNKITKFCARVKDNEIYKGKYSKITIINKNNVEKEFPAYYIKKMNNCSPFWNVEYGERLTELNTILFQYDAKVKEGESYIDNLTKITIVNKNGVETKLSPKNIKRMKKNHIFLNRIN
jgi:uncharacterized protein with GYD domain